MLSRTTMAVRAASTSVTGPRGLHGGSHSTTFSPATPFANLKKLSDSEAETLAKVSEKSFHRTFNEPVSSSAWPLW